MPRRRDRVAPPPRKGGWDCRFANNTATLPNQSPKTDRVYLEGRTIEPAEAPEEALSQTGEADGIRQLR